MISPIENSGMILRTQDFSGVRHNEENHSANVHVRIQESIDKSEEANAHSVREKDNADKSGTHHDARDEGRNKYFSLRTKQKKEKEQEDGVVVKKKPGGFNITI